MTSAMMMMIGVAVVVMALPAAAAAAVQDFAGKWTDSGDGGYGGEFVVCVDAAAGTAQGFYSEVGYVRGSVMEVAGVATWSGFWYEAGDSNDLSNWGPFTVQLSDDAESFNGTWSYASAPGEGFIYDGTRIGDPHQPTPGECMATNTQGLTAQYSNDAAENAFTLQGSWLGNGTYEWHTCIVGARFRSSYIYDYKGEPTRGFISGEVQLDGQLLMGKYWEGDETGLFILGLLNNREMISTYWMVDSLDDVDMADIDDFDTHAVEFTRRVAVTPTWADCNKNYALSVGGTPTDDYDDDDDNSTEAPSGTVVALSVLLAVFCATTIAGGGYYVYSNQVRRRKQARRNSRSSN